MFFCSQACSGPLVDVDGLNHVCFVCCGHRAGIGRQLPVLQGLPVSNNNKPVSDHNRRVSDNNRPVSDSRLSSRFDTSAIEAAHQPRQQADSTAAAAAAVASPAAPAVPAGVPPAAGANAAPQPQPPQPPQRPDTQLQTLHTGGNASPGFVGRSMEAGPEAWGIPHAAHAAGSGMQPAAAAAAAVAPPVLPPLTAGLSPEALRLHGGQLLQQAGVQAQQGVGGEHAVGWGRAHGQMGGSSLQMGVSVGQYGLGWGPVLGTGAGVHAGMQQQAVPPPPALQPSHSAGPAGAAGWLASPAAGGISSQQQLQGSTQAGRRRCPGNQLLGIRQHGAPLQGLLLPLRLVLNRALWDGVREVRQPRLWGQPLA